MAIYVRDDEAINSEVSFRFSNGVIEAVGVYLKSRNLIVITVYRQPDDILGNHRSNSKEFKAMLESLSSYLSALSSPTPDIILCGDLNLPHAIWSSGRCSAGASKEEQLMVSSMYSLTVEHLMIQQIDQPTHRNGNILDVLFTNNIDLVHSFFPAYSILSDHFLIEFKAVYKSDTDIHTQVQDEISPERHISFRDYNFFSEAIDWNNLNTAIQDHNWPLEFRGCTAEDMLNKFCSVILSFVADHVPLRSSNQKSRNKIPRDRRILMRTRRRINTQLAKSPAPRRRDALINRRVEIEKCLQKSYHTEAANRETRAVDCIKKNPKYFFSFAKSFSQVKIGIGPLIDAAKGLISCPLKMAEILSEQYASVFSQPRYSSDSPSELFPDVAPHSGLSDVFFSESDLLQAIEELKPNSSAGPDEFPANLLIMCRHSLVRPLFSIWRCSMNTGEVPATCKFANIVPIHKGKSKAEAKNYRPVALTSLLIKVFEKVIRKHIVSFMDEHELFNQYQHGFRSGHSCLSQLLAHFDHITRQLEEGKAVDVIYLDFSKAFDKVDIGLILRKLKSLGIGGNLGRWLHGFLLGRMQSVLVNGHKSSQIPVKSGVPQGSVLGPLLFLILIGDIDKEVSSSFVSSFADDTRVGHSISCDQDVRQLQSDLEAVYRWAIHNNMEFNSEKFEHLRYNPKPSTDISPEYKSDTGSLIQTKESVRDLGVIMSSSASFSEHINQRVDKLKSKIGWILRTFKTRDPLPMLTLWKTLVLCEHDYCSQLWNPDRVGDIQSLELLQRSFIRKISGMQRLSYWEQLKALKLYSLERRRERYVIIYTWRILEGSVPNISQGSTAITAAWHVRRGRTCKVPSVLSSASSRVQSIRRASLGIKGPRLFNCLPMHLRNLSGVSVDMFQFKLDKYLMSIPDEPLIPGYTMYRTVDSNSILYWIVHTRLQAREPAYPYLTQDMLTEAGATTTSP